MNFIFISPQFPKHYWNFCDRLKKNGVNVLGIGDSPYDALSDELKNALTEYYYLPHLDDYGEMVKAVGFFTFKYGKIDWIESNMSSGLHRTRACARTFTSRRASSTTTLTASRTNRP